MAKFNERTVNWISAGASVLGFAASSILEGPAKASAGLLLGGGVNLLTAYADRKVQEASYSPLRKQFNHDITLLIGDAVAAIVMEEADNAGKSTDSLVELAKNIPPIWMVLVQDEGRIDLTAAQTMDALALAHGARPASPEAADLFPLGNKVQWIDWLTLIESRFGILISPELRKTLAERLSKHLPEMVRRRFKTDFEHKGSAYAAIHLAYLDEVRRQLKALRVGQAKSHENDGKIRPRREGSSDIQAVAGQAASERRADPDAVQRFGLKERRQY